MILIKANIAENKRLLFYSEFKSFGMFKNGRFDLHTYSHDKLGRYRIYFEYQDLIPRLQRQ